MQERILEWIRTQAKGPLTTAELAQALELSDPQLPELMATVQKMETEGLLVRTRLGRYGAPERMNLAVGRLQAHPKGFAFLLPDDRDQGDVYVGKENLAGAMHGDRVVVRLGRSNGVRLEGEVVRILTRAYDRLVGTYTATRTAGYVTPDEPRVPMDVLVPRSQAAGARTGDKVVVRLVRHPEARRGAEGQIIERLGRAGDPGVDILSLIRRHQLPEIFPQKVQRAVAEVPTEIAPDELSQRLDLRENLVITIDGEDAKDLDDAVSVVALPEGGWRLGVHIADVAFYVKEGTPLDREAYRRGTSVYLADRVLPMLPPQLSNQLCSLNPGEDKLTLTCQMNIDGRGLVKSYQIVPSVIRSKARMTYTAVHAILAGNDPDLRQRHADQAPMLEEMHRLMQVLRQRREARGALDLDLPEAKLVLNEQGALLDVRRHQRTDAERIIEEFMLLANETVAAHALRHKLPCVFRVHEEPAAEKIIGLGEFLALFGYRKPLAGRKVTPMMLQDVTKWAAGRDDARLLNSVLLRSLKQAIYHHQNLGHFGLAAANYCHFTSPIRRYPDLFVHRVLRESWSHKGRLPARRRARLETLAEEIGRHASERERAAVEAERETADLKKAEFMVDKLGEVFSGIISSVTTFGFFATLDNTVEGLVHVSTLTDDYYHHHEKAYALIGERTRRMFRLGDAVQVRVAKVALQERQIDFEYVAGGSQAAASAVDSERADGHAGRGRHGRQDGRRGHREPTLPPPAVAPLAATGAAGDAESIGPRHRQKAAASQAATARAARGEQRRDHRRDREPVELDMWGVPVPPARRRSGVDDDHDDSNTAANMFAMSAKAQERPARRRPAAVDQAPAPKAQPAPPTGGKDSTQTRKAAGGRQRSRRGRGE